MSLSTPDKESQATELLRVASLPDIRRQLLRYAVKLTGGNEDAANEYYQQALLDGHDAIQRRGFAGTRPEDYKFYLLKAINSKHEDALRYRSGLAPLPEGLEQIADSAEQLPCTGPAHLAQQVAREIEHHPDRMVLRLHAEGHSMRAIEDLTGRPKSSVQRALDRLKDSLRETFSQAWASLD